MPLPSSGEIRVSQINTELDRASNTANSNFAGGATPQTGSLFKLGEGGGVNQTAPHAMSEWYGFSADTVRLVYQSSVSDNNGPIYYSSSNIFSSSYPNNEATSCSDAIALSVNTSSIPGAQIFYNIEDADGNLYLDSFRVFYSYNVTANTNLRLMITSGYIKDNGFQGTEQVQILRDFNQTGSGTDSFFVSAVTGSPARTYITFLINADGGNGGGTMSITNINTQVAC